MNPIPDGIVFEYTGTFDGHVHFRQKKNGLLQIVVRDTRREFGGALAMCNLLPPVTTTELALAHKAEIDSEIPTGEDFTVLYTYYLTDEADADAIIDGFRRRIWVACKYMPNNGSTNTKQALTSFRKGYPIYERMEKEGVPLLLHAETVGDHIDPFDAPSIFINEEMLELRERFPALKVCLEHIADGTAADYMEEAERNGEPTWATLTPQHMVYSRNRIFQRGSVRNGTFKRGSNPSFVCWPLLQREEPHRQKLLRQVARGNKKIGLGTDRAIHLWPTKACEDGCGGCYPHDLALPIYATGFEEIGSFEHFESFACRNIPCGLYGLPQGTKKVRLIKDAANPSRMPEMIENCVVPILHGETIPWRTEIVRE